MSKLPRIMGIVNATGNSFSEGASSDPASALDRALKLIDDGADIIDVGAESTRPGADEVTAAEECGRIGDLILRIKAARPSIAVSIDTRHALTAKMALDSGAEYINDVSMLREDSSIAALVCEYGSYLILCHSRGTPQTMGSSVFQQYPSGVIDAVISELTAAASFAISGGVPGDRIIYDPGFGFAKSPEQQLEMLRFAGLFRKCGTTLAGVSRKSFLGRLTGEENPAERTGSTLAAELHLAGCGIDIIRTHNVKNLRDALTVSSLLTKE